MQTFAFIVLLIAFVVMMFLYYKSTIIRKGQAKTIYNSHARCFKLQTMLNERIGKVNELLAHDPYAEIENLKGEIIDHKLQNLSHEYDTYDEAYDAIKSIKAYDDVRPLLHKAF
jgi:hypothetical protein